MTTNAPIPLSDEQIAALSALRMSKRGGIVRDHILQHGSVTTADLNALGYDHPPRAVRDLKEAGASVSKEMVTVDGRRMARYFFDGAANRDAKGQLPRPKKFDDKLKADYGFKCNICQGVFAARALQIDHRVPYEIAGDPEVNSAETYQPLCAPDNRAKSWSCEHCPNWTTRDVEVCKSCFWARPEGYSHVETRPERRITITFQGNDVLEYEKLRAVAETENKTVTQLARDVLTAE